LTNAEIDPQLYLQRYPALAALSEIPNTNTVRRNVLVRCSELLRHPAKNVGAKDNTTLQDGDTRLRADNPLLHRPGFDPIPVEKIGLYQDRFRKSVAGG
jgi:hypothetical protein